MTEILSSAQMRSIEAAAIESGQATGLALMERAGTGVVGAIFAEWPDLASGPHRAVVLCGPGNNGGDGFVVARLLDALGWRVDVFLYGEPERLPPDAAANYRRWGAVGGIHRLAAPRPTSEQMKAFMNAASHLSDTMRDLETDAPPPPFVVIDALFGIGLSRPLTGIDQIVACWDHLIRFRDLNNARVVALDIPSGLDADTGNTVCGDEMAGAGVLPADLTVTFHGHKPGHLAGPRTRFCGKVVVVDIGLGPWDTHRHDA